MSSFPSPTIFGLFVSSNSAQQALSLKTKVQIGFDVVLDDSGSESRLGRVIRFISGESQSAERERLVQHCVK